MNTIGVLLLAAATAPSGVFGKAHAGGKHFLRSHVVADGPAPPGGPMAPGGAMGCRFGHPGCGGGASCPGGGMAGGPGMGGPGMGGGAPGMGGGAPGMGAASNRRFPNTRSQIFFVDPPGMKIGWQTVGGGVERVYLPGQLTVPARYNFNQGYIYRLKLTDLPGRPGLALYPTLEVAPSTPATDAFLTHNPIPAQFTDEDFDQVAAGNFVTKVIYLPDPKFQELAIQGVETLVSTRLEPGVDPILEADRRGTILMIVRLGAIDLEMPTNIGGSTVVQPPTMMNGSTIIPGAAPGTVLPPGSLPPGTGPFAPTVNPATAPPTAPNVPLDAQPAAPVTPVAPGAEPGPVPPAAEELPPAEPTPTPPPAEVPPAGDVPPADVPPPAPGDVPPLTLDMPRN